MSEIDPAPSGDGRQSERWRSRYSALAGLPFDADALESRIVWIWGTPRSGSTWLLRQLCAPARLNGRWPMGFKPGVDPAAPLPAVPFNEFGISHHIAPKAGAPVAVGDRLLPPTPNTYMANLSSYAFSLDFAEIWAPELRRLTLVRLAAAVDRAREAGMNIVPDPLLVIKEVNGTHAAGAVMRLFPRSRMLLMLRDGRDVVDSWAEAVGPGGWMTQGAAAYEGSAQRLEWIREACAEWASTIDVASETYAKHPPELRRKLRYEDLRGASERELIALRSWLGLSAEPDLVAGIVAEHAFENLPADRRGPRKHARAARPGLWRESLSEVEQEAALEIMGSRLRALGYEA